MFKNNIYLFNNNIYFNDSAIKPQEQMTSGKFPFKNISNNIPSIYNSFLSVFFVTLFS